MAARGRNSLAWLTAVALVAGLAAFQVVRTAAAADREAHPQIAARLWPSHPAVMTDEALLEVARAATKGASVPASVLVDVRRIAERDPLSPDPYVIAGAIAETQNRGAAGERLLLAARDRDPRSRGARFLLADRYLRTGRVAAGLIEMQALVGLQSRGMEAFVPALVAYAQTPGAVSQLRAFFARYPRAEAGILSTLATDPANADLVLALASNWRNPDPDWRGVLANALVGAGQFSRAYSVWARLSGQEASRRLFNGGFAPLKAPPPFNWQFPQTAEGVAEPSGNAGLEVLYYGHSRAVLASQLLMLPPGQYRLAMNVIPGSNESAVHWTIRCLPGAMVVADLALQPGAAGGRFTIPADCEAQWLELQGLPGEIPRNSELTIRGLRLVEEARP